MKKTIIALLLLGCAVTACSQQQQARQPVSRSSGSFMKESVERNKKLVASEEQQIDSIIKSNPKIKYIASTKGYWYYYDVENTNDTINPKRGDVAYFNYDVKDLKGNIIYSEVELRPQVYYVDKENIMMGLRDGIKLMNKGEKVTFLFPSHMAYGYHGDNKKIGVNEPLICTVTLNDIKPESEVKEN
jgi:gliding motility-associated peptidyl-prolyl isomerase